MHLSRRQTTAGHTTVTFFATRPEAERALGAALDAFGATLPERVAFERLD